MKKYYKVEMTNGYCGCDEVKIIAVDENVNVYEFSNEFLEDYSFIEPDSRFIGYEDDYESEDDYFTAYDEYQNNCEVDITELTKEEYIDECENYGFNIDVSALE